MSPEPPPSPSRRSVLRAAAVIAAVVAVPVAAATPAAARSTAVDRTAFQGSAANTGPLVFSWPTSTTLQGLTATDASWFPPGRQVLAAEADTPAGPVRTRMTVTVSPPPALPGRTVLNGEVALTVPAGQGTVAPVRTGFRDVVVNGNEILLNGTALAGSVTVTLHLSGTPVADGTPGLVRAVIDSETEAQPRQLTTTSANPGVSAPTGAGSS